VSPSGRLSIGGLDVCDLAQEHGTPLFIYDEVHLRSRCNEAVTAWPNGVAYATKAFLCKAMAQLALEEGMSLDVSTAGEMHVALAAGATGADLVLHGNNKSDAEIDTAIDHGIGRVVVDSFDEIDRLQRLSHGLPEPISVLIRVTPGVEAHTHEFVTTGVEDTKFGFSLMSGAASEAAARLRAVPSLELVGAHAHIGSQVFRVDSFERAVAMLAPFVVEHRLPELCIGGGLGVAYVTGETAPTMSDWAEAVRAACVENRVPPSVRITAEPGRSIVAAAAITVYRVGTVKSLPGLRDFVSVDGGMSDNPRPVLYGSGYEAFLPQRTTHERPRLVDVVGKHCESGDFIVKNASLPEEVSVGDFLATPVTGAYGHTMASNYNKVPRPAVLFVRDGQAREVVKRETLDDLLRLDQ
jgi:diaminopimelate decarboxylase